MDTTKSKKPIVSIKKIQKSDNEVTRVDANTFYVKSSDPEKEPYMVFNSMNEGWLCDCMHFVMSLQDDGHTPPCKHIKKCLLFG